MHLTLAKSSSFYHIITCFSLAAVVEDFPPDLSQPTNLLVTLLTYSSIALQNTKGIVGHDYTYT